MRRNLLRVGALSLLLCAVLVAGAWGYDRVASARVTERYPAPGEVLTVQGRPMHYLCLGDAEPALVLVHGYGGGVLDWTPLMAELATTHRVCAFDRFGSDYSDLVGRQSADDIVSDLHVALTHLSIEQPVVIGHSLGGALVQLYAARYPVRGVVLLEGLSADIADEVTRRLGSYGALRPLAQLGLLRPLAPTFVHPSYPNDLRRQMIALRSRSTALVALAQEGRTAQRDLSGAALLRAEGRVTAPWLIVAAGATDVPEGEAFSASLQTLAARHPDATFYLVPGASHYLIASHAAQVAGYVKTWLQANEASRHDPSDAFFLPLGAN